MQRKKSNLTKIALSKLFEHGLSSIIFAITLLPLLFILNYVFAVKTVDGCTPCGNTMSMIKSSDLVNWSDPVEVLREPDERIFNQSVCHDGKRYVMAYETDAAVKFTLRFAESDDLLNWRKIEGCVFGKDRYVACPALRFSEGYYYMMYSAWDLKTWWFETFMVRSKDLMNWESSPHNPLLVPDHDQLVAPGCPPHDEEQGKNCNGRECNNSDPDLVEWEGKTRVYFTGGCQHYGGRLQYAQYDGPVEEFFHACFCKSSR